MEPAPFQPRSLVGQLLDGRYRLAAHLANGGMGAIFRAEHVYMRKELAVKLLRPELSAMPDLAERFRREAEIAASLEHPNIVRVTDFGRSPEGWLFLVMELLHGESLFERMRVGPMAPQDALPVLVQICAGLAAAHARGVVHRDLKPENVFLVENPTPWAKILDFGIAKLTDPVVSSDTAAGVVVGTPEYVSPEQATGAPVDGRADLYAVGIVGWRMLAGYHPFPTDDSRRLLMMQATRPVPRMLDARPELAQWPGLADAIDRACAKEPSERFQTAEEMRAALESCLPEPLRPPPATAPSPAGFRLQAFVDASTPVTRREREGTPTQRLGAPGASDADAARAIPSSPSPSTATTAAPLATAPPLPLARRPTLASVLALALLALALVGAGGYALARHRAAEERAQAAAEGARQAQIELSRREEARRAAEARARADAEARAAEAAREAALAQERAREEERERELSRLAAAARTGSGAARLDALVALRKLGAESRVPVLESWLPLLGDRDCEVRRAAARRLGELRDPRALPQLRRLAQRTVEVDRGYLFKQREPACGAAEAAAAARQIETSTARRASR